MVISPLQLVMVHKPAELRPLQSVARLLLMVMLLLPLAITFLQEVMNR